MDRDARTSRRRALCSVRAATPAARHLVGTFTKGVAVEPATCRIGSERIVPDC